MFKLPVLALSLLANIARSAPEVFDDQWIVKFKPSLFDSEISRADYVRQALGEGIFDSEPLNIKEWSLAEFGFDAVAASFTEAQRDILRGLPDFEYMQPNIVFRGLQAGSQPNPGSWGIDRIDNSLDGTYRYPNDGRNANVYIIDSGVDVRHPNFEGRARWGANFVPNSPDTDQHGHGTHVGGSAASATYGVAKGVTVWAVKVLNENNSGALTWIVDGIDWVTRNSVRGSVANMSFGEGGRGGPEFRAIDDAVNALIRSGVTAVVAAGNEAQNACNPTPARVPLAITVGSSTRTDGISSFSNFGRCVDIFAPGSDITSTFPSNRVGTISGTSMAAPHVAGVAALVLSRNPGLSPAQVTSAILNAGTRNALSGLDPASPNLLLSNRI